MQLQPKPELRFKYPLREKFISIYGSEVSAAIRKFCEWTKANHAGNKIAYRTVRDEHFRITMGETTEIKDCTLHLYAQFLNLPVHTLKAEYHKYLSTQNNR